MKLRIVSLLLAALAARLTSTAAESGKLDAEGFIREWLVLAPASIAGSNGLQEIDKQQLPNEAKPAAKEGAKQKIGSDELTWMKVVTPAFYIDFRELFPNQSEYVIAWAVAYIVSPDDKTGVTLRMNSNDQGKVYLNGMEVVKFTETRALEKDMEDSAPNLALKKGVNVIVLKVINEENNWQGSVRLVDAAGKPLSDLKVQTQP